MPPLRAGGADSGQGEVSSVVVPAMKRGGRSEPPRRGRARDVVAPDPGRGSKPRQQVKDAGGTELHVRFLRSPRTRRVPSPLFARPKWGAAPHNGGIFFVLGTLPRLTGLECRTFNGHPTPRGGARPPGRPSGPSRLGTPKTRSGPAIRPPSHPWAEWGGDWRLLLSLTSSLLVCVCAAQGYR